MLECAACKCGEWEKLAQADAETAVEEFWVAELRAAAVWLGSSAADRSVALGGPRTLMRRLPGSGQSSSLEHSISNALLFCSLQRSDRACHNLGRRE